MSNAWRIPFVIKENPLRVRLALALTTAAVCAGSVAASANPVGPLPVGVTVGPAGACVTVSLQTTRCVPLSAVARPTSNSALPVALPYVKGGEVCYDPSPTSKGPCVPLPQS